MSALIAGTHAGHKNSPHDFEANRPKYETGHQAHKMRLTRFGLTQPGSLAKAIDEGRRQTPGIGSGLNAVRKRANPGCGSKTAR